jgi:hypothetical protein
MNDVTINEPQAALAICIIIVCWAAYANKRAIRNIGHFVMFGLILIVAFLYTQSQSVMR